MLFLQNPALKKKKKKSPVAVTFLFLEKNIKDSQKVLLLYHKELCNFPKLVLVPNIRMQTDRFSCACTLRETSQGNDKRKFQVYENADCNF